MIDSPQAPPREEGIHLKRHWWEEHCVIHTSKMIKSSVFNLSNIFQLLRRKKIFSDVLTYLLILDVNKDVMYIHRES